MSEEKIQQSLTNLDRALTRLEEALKEPDTISLVIDGTIQRFEFVIELFWKAFKRILSREGIQVSTPRESIKQAYQVGWIEDEEAWLAMLRDRNETSHVYDEATARRIYESIKRNFVALERVFGRLRVLTT
ncbi:MAG: nucleotidyltransferase substrate binding protein [Chromatiales bacterium]|nr:nucleotidyltransferase substrate binding protein [Chromatiales bacterium]